MNSPDGHKGSKGTRIIESISSNADTLRLPELVTSAEQLLAQARSQGDPGKLISALTDLGVLHSQTGSCPLAIALLEEALMLAQQICDEHNECDVLGNLGMAVVAKDTLRALGLFQQELRLAQRINSVAEKTALTHLGIYHLRTGAAPQAFGYLDKALILARSLGDQQHEAELLWLMAIQYAEVDDRSEADVRAQAAIDILGSFGKPQTQLLSDHLDKYRRGAVGSLLQPSTSRKPAAFGGEYIVAGAWASPAQVEPARIVSGPGWLRMGFTALKALTRFVGSGMKRVSLACYEDRQRTCATCEHHTGLRCRVCGCFTSIKAWLPCEECPVRRWPS